MSDERAVMEEEEDDDFGGADLPPPPPPPAPSLKMPPPPPEFIELARQIRGTDDRLEQGSIAYDALMASLANVLDDDTLSASDRRREMRTISAAAAKVFPYKRLHEAERKVDQHLAMIDQRKRTRAGADLETRRTSSGGKVIPIRGSAVPDGIKP